MTVNKVILVGNLGRDPETRTTQSGSTVANLSLATKERQKVGEEWEEHTEWHRVVVFGRTAENVAKFCAKGKQLYIEGKLRTRKWTDKDGVEKYSTEIIGDVVQFLGGGGVEREAAPAREPARAPAKKPGKHTRRDVPDPAGYGAANPDNDLPF